MMGDTKIAVPWNVQEVAGRVKEQLRVWTQRREPVVRRSQQLKDAIRKDELAHLAVTQAMDAMKRIDGEHATFEAQAAEIKSRLDASRVAFDANEREWQLLNDVIKQADLAYDGLHWLCYAESDLDKHDKVGVWAPDYPLREKVE